MDNLLDELQGSSILLKINVRAGYNEVWMNLDDEQKRAFKTHGGHDEYVMVPFGLTNAPATFQGLMNSIFQL